MRRTVCAVVYQDEVLVFEIMLFVGTPLFAIWLNRQKFGSWLDPVWLCYGAGLLMTFFPSLGFDKAMAEHATEVCIPLAIPMLLFQTNIRAWLAQSRTAMIALGIAVSSVLISAMVTGVLFRASYDQIPYVLAMMTATLTGGSPNLLSVGKAIEAPESVLLLTNASDLVTGGVYLLLLLTVAQRVVGIFLKKSQPATELKQGVEEEAKRMSVGEKIQEGLLALGSSIVIAGVSAGLTYLITKSLYLPFVLLGLTTGGLLGSGVSRLRRMRVNMELGNYLILVFCVAVGSMTDIGALMSEGSIVFWIAAVMLSLSLLIHYTACWVFKIDTDQAIIASTAAVMGPPLVVPVANSLKNPEVLVTGLTSGLVGYALGNYLGLLVFWVAGG